MTTTQQYSREDWVLFRSLNTIGQKAGVTKDRLPRLIVKELVDNALDATGSCNYGPIAMNSEVSTAAEGFFVQDTGKGIQGSDEEIAAIFSIRRPLTSSKVFRMPTRGCLGNGLRVVAGAVLASGGSLIVRTSGRSLTLEPQDDGTTKVAETAPWSGAGTRVEVRFGPDLADVDDNIFAWAGIANQMAGKGSSYKGKPSPHFFDSDAFFELLHAAPADETVQTAVSRFDGCSGERAGQVCGTLADRPANSVSRRQADIVLTAAKALARVVTPERFGKVGVLDKYSGYAHMTGGFRPDGRPPFANIPFVIEVWARKADRAKVTMCVNRTPVCASVSIWRADQKTHYTLYGCGLSDEFKACKTAEFEILVNVQSPYVPLVTDGKEPNLDDLSDELFKCLKKAVAQANRKEPRNRLHNNTKKAIVLTNLSVAIAKVSGNGRHRYSLRQLFYAVRPYVLDALGEEPDYDYFAEIVKVREREQGHDLPGIYRDNRGILYHPHLRQEIPLGTRTVEQYERPAWTFNKALYCEKEGFFPILRDVEWPERNDCALLTSKGFATFAVRDLLDLLDQSDEPLTIFCIHDADGSGTLIYEELLDGIKERSGREVQVINLGLEPDEAVEMGLDVEPAGRKDRKRVGVADYVRGEWRDWLQTNRCELNAMTTPQFLEWLDRKIATHDVGKVIPPSKVMTERLEIEVESRLRQQIADRVLREADLDGQVRNAVQELQKQVNAESRRLPATVPAGLAAEPSKLWANVIERTADKLCDRAPA
jgi:hypothetical protein